MTFLIVCGAVRELGLKIEDRYIQTRQRPRMIMDLLWKMLQVFR